jgi:lysophospholipase L1-like esterase
MPTSSPLDRRGFLAAAAALPLTAPSNSLGPSSSLVPARPGIGPRVLFQGDSITDCHRDRSPERASTANDQDALGRGYAFLAAAGLLCGDPAAEQAPRLEIFNRGVSGDRVPDLHRRWPADCLDLKPDVLSILIGVNDIWRVQSGVSEATVEDYEREYDALLRRTREALPRTRLVVCEPFVLRCGAVNDGWFPDFDHYRAAARRVARTHGATFVAFHTLFERATRLAPPEHWAADGVHPSDAGAALMAQAWLAAVAG